MVRLWWQSQICRIKKNYLTVFLMKLRKNIDLKIDSEEFKAQMNFILAKTCFFKQSHISTVLNFCSNFLDPNHDGLDISVLNIFY
jgi:hypothetical protein